MTRVAIRVAGTVFRAGVGLGRSRWGWLRVMAAVALLALLVHDNPARLTRLQYAALPDFDMLAEARRLRTAGDFDGALVVLDGALADSRKDVDSGFASPDADSPDADSPNTDSPDADLASADAMARRQALLAERSAALADRDSFVRRAKEFGVGALLGTGESLEALAGAITADLFIVGDVRDLAIQGGRLALDGEADPFIAVLSAVGVATTLQPGLDWLPAFLKTARKAGCVGARLAGSLGTLCREALRTGRFDAVRRFAEHAATIVRRASPAGAVRLLRHADDVADLERLARFVERHPGAALALHVTGKSGARLVASGVHGAEQAVLLASRKGPHGAAWLRGGAYRLLRPHPLLGVAKGLYKGNVQAGVAGLAAWASRRLDRFGWLVIPAVAAWVLLEVGLLRARWRRSTSSETADAKAATSQHQRRAA